MNLLSPYFSTVFPFFLFFFFLYKWLFRDHSSTKSLPSPTKLPIAGNLHHLGRLPHHSLHYLSQQHGELMLLHFGKKPVLIVSSAKAAREILKTHDIIFCDRPTTTMYKKLLYNCRDVATAPFGDYWRQMRSICVLHLLSHNRVQSFHHVKEEEIALMLEEIKRSSTEVNLGKMFAALASDLICRAVFGMKCNGKRDGIDFKELMKKHEEFCGGFYVGDFIPWLAWINHLTGLKTQVEKSSQKMDKFLEGIIQEREDDQTSYQGKKDEKMKDFVDILLELQQDQTDNSNVDRDSIKAIILDMFVAGTTTTSATLEWAMSELLRNPRVLDALTKEVRGITTGKTGITEHDLEKMKYLKAVINETFRLHPPVPLLLPRISMKEAEINGYKIGARVQVIINTWTIHRDPEFWENPEDFYPERFLNSPIDFKGQDFNLIPFGSGRRGCPGMSFAMANIELALASLISHFNWALSSKADGKGLDMTEYPGVTVHRKNPLFALATPPC